MYPGLRAPLLILLVLFAAGLAFLAVRQPVTGRLALRQVSRRWTEGSLIVGGSMLGTAILVGALIVGDTLGFSVRQEAYRTLGPVDERVIAPDANTGAAVQSRLSVLSRSGQVDGLINGIVDQAAASSGANAQPRVLVWGLDFAQAERFGRAGGSSGLAGSTPRPGEVVLNAPLARSLEASAGSRITLYLYGRGLPVTVARVVAENGLAGTGLGAPLNRNAFIAPDVLRAAAAGAGLQPKSVTLISNRGGVQSGNALTPAVTARIRTALGPLAGRVVVETPKDTVLTEAKATGDALGALFLMIGSFSIIAGALLLVNVFTMLADERKTQLGMLRAVGMKRSVLVGSFTLEGMLYAVASAIPGALLGIGVGWAVARVAAQIFRGWSADGSGLRITFAMSPTSLINGVALGLVIAGGTIFATSVRISRFNVIAAIRDLPASPSARKQRRTVLVSSAFAGLLTAASVPAVAQSAGVQVFLFPALAAGCLIPLLVAVMPRRVALTLVSGAVLAWELLVSVVRPAVFDSPSMAVFVVLGALVAFSAVVLVSENQSVLIRPLRRLIERPSQTGLAVRLGVAYPMAKRFRTGATLVMYTIVTLIVVLLMQITGVISKSVDNNVAAATAGYSLRLDMNPQQAAGTISALHAGPFRRDIASVSPLLSAPARATDPGRRTAEPLSAIAVGVQSGSVSAMRFDQRLPGLTADREVWTAIARDPRYVAVDKFFGATGGPSGKYYAPGDSFQVTDLRTGRTETKIIAGVLANAMVFYDAGNGAATSYPFVASASAVHDQFGESAAVTSALVTTRPGVVPDKLASRLQARYLAASLVATPIETNVRRMFAANTAFFRLMQGFLALGLLVGVTGLGVVMVRAVRERRRTIGVLRALGFRARTVQRAFLAESAFVASQGIILGCVLGVLLTWLMYLKSASFDGVRAGYPISWFGIVGLAVATFAASLLATLIPARRAAAVQPALAVRVAQ